MVHQSAAKGFHTHPVQAASIYGELLAMRQQPMQAARVWLMAGAQSALDEMDRQGARALLDRLALDDAQRTAAAQAVPTPGASPAVRRPMPGNARETPPA